MAALKASLAKGTGGGRAQADPADEAEPRRAARKSADQSAEPKRARKRS
jgi:hypothetical protein